LLVVFELRRLEHGEAKVGDLECEATVHHTIRAGQVAVALDLAAVYVDHALDDVVDEVVLEVDLELDGLILKNVLSN
jgi:hypothetical protein